MKKKIKQVIIDFKVFLCCFLVFNILLSCSPTPNTPLINIKTPVNSKNGAMNFSTKSVSKDLIYYPIRRTSGITATISLKLTFTGICGSNYENDTYSVAISPHSYTSMYITRKYTTPIIFSASILIPDTLITICPNNSSFPNRAFYTSNIEFSFSSQFPPGIHRGLVAPFISESNVACDISSCGLANIEINNANTTVTLSNIYYHTQGGTLTGNVTFSTESGNNVRDTNFSLSGPLSNFEANSDENAGTIENTLDFSLASPKNVNLHVHIENNGIGSAFKRTEFHLETIPLDKTNDTFNWSSKFLNPDRTTTNTFLANGNYKITVTATNQDEHGGGYIFVDNESLIINNHHHVPIVLQITPNSASTVRDNNLTFKVDAGTSRNWIISIPGTNWTRSGTGSQTFTINGRDLGALSEGSYSVNLKSDQEEAGQLLIIDNTPPIIGDLSVYGQNGLVYVLADITDNGVSSGIDTANSSADLYIPGLSIGIGDTQFLPSIDHVKLKILVNKTPFSIKDLPPGPPGGGGGDTLPPSEDTEFTRYVQQQLALAEYTIKAKDKAGNETIKSNVTQTQQPPEFFNTEDITTLSNYISNLSVPENTASQLLQKVKEIDVLNQKINSLISRTPAETAKITTLQNQISTIDTQRQQLASALMASLTNLNTQKDDIKTHLNKITNTTFIKDYSLDEKPDSVGSYSDRVYFADQDASNTLLTNNVTLYSPDSEDENQDTLKETWEVNQDRVEVIDPTVVFDGANYVSDEIYLAKDLISDYIANKFIQSGESLSSENVEAMRVLNDLITQLKTHTELLKTKSKKLSDNYNNNFQKLKESEAKQQEAVLLPLALAMEKSGDYSDNTYVMKVASTTPLQIQNFHTQSEILDWIKAKIQTVTSFKNSPIGTKEKVMAILLGYSSAEWNDFKRIDPQGATQLAAAMEEMLNAFLIPTTTTGALLTFAGPIAKLTGKLSPIATKVLGKGLAQADRIQYLAKIKTEIKATYEVLKKYIGKVPAKDCLFNAKGFHIESVCSLPILSDLAVSYLKTTGKGLKKYYDAASKSIPVTEILAKAPSKLKKSAFPTEWGSLYDEMGTIFNNFKNSPGIKINKLKDYEIYFADFKPNSIGSVKIQGMTGDRAGKFIVGSDYEKAATKFISQYPQLVPVGTTAEKFEEIRRKMGLIWHHHEDLQSMVLVDERIHKGVGHFGAVSIINNISKYGANMISNWKKIIVYE